MLIKLPGQPPAPEPTFNPGQAAVRIDNLGIDQKTVFLLLALTVLMALLEGAGLGMLMPILTLVSSSDVAGGGFLHDFMHKALAWSESFGQAYRLPLILSLAFLLIVLRYFVNYLRDVRVARLRLGIIRLLRRRLIDALVNSRLGYIGANRSGELQATLTVECERAAEAAAAKVAIATSIALIAVYAGLLLLLSPLLTLCAVPILGTVGLVLHWQRRKSADLTQAVSKYNLRLGDQTSEFLGGITRIKMRGQQERTSGELFGTIERIFKGMLSLERLRLMVEISMHPLLAFAGLSIIFIAVQVIRVDLAVLGVFLFVLLRMAPQLNMLVSFWAYHHSCRASLVRVLNLAEQAELNLESAGGQQQLPDEIPDLSCSEVWFSYPGAPKDHYALKRVDCVIPSGAFTAVVGRSGAGKSTLINLFAAYHSPQRGQVMSGGRNLAEYRLKDYRKRIGMVEQTPFLFNGTIRENLNYGVEPPLDDQGLKGVLKESGSWEFVKRLPGGLEAMVGERGSRLSQGQKQRLAIAHALATGARLLILDEPTSALDKSSELIVAQTLKNLAGRLTIVVIAHRLETVRRADLILVLEGGRLIAQGDHDSLLKECETYRELFGNL